MAEIIKIDPAEKYFSLTWMIEARCNYNCSYCPPELHNNFSKQYSLDDLKHHWTNIHAKTQHKNLKYKINFTGGEVTINKNFLPFVRWLTDNYGNDIYQLLLTTNGSASVNYYKNLYQHIDNISFSFHSEFADNSFFDKIVELHNIISDRVLHVNIMNESWNSKAIPGYIELLDKYQINYSLNNIEIPITLDLHQSPQL